MQRIYTMTTDLYNDNGFIQCTTDLYNVQRIYTMCNGFIATDLFKVETLFFYSLSHTYNMEKVPDEVAILAVINAFLFMLNLLFVIMCGYIIVTSLP